MKYLLTLLSSIVFTQIAISQIPDYFGNNPQWSCDYEFPGAGGDPYQDKYIYHLNGTETIDGNTYHLMYMRRFRHEGWGTGTFEPGSDLVRKKVRQEGRNVYYYNSATESDSLLVSYEYEVGDPIHHIPTQLVTAIDSILLTDGSYRRVFYFDEDDPNARFIEGIGTMWGALDHNNGSVFAEFFGIDYDPAWDIYEYNCYSENGVTLWSALPDLSCGFTLNIEKEDDVSNKLAIYPNPATNELTCELHDLQIETISVLNVQGQVLKTLNKQSENTIKIDLSDLNKGMYIIQFTNENGLVAQEKFIKK